MVKSLPAMWETQVQSLDWEDPLEKEMATHSSILAWKNPMDWRDIYVCVCMCVCVYLKRQNAMGEREGNPEMEKESGSKEGEQI